MKKTVMLWIFAVVIFAQSACQSQGNQNDNKATADFSSQASYQNIAAEAASKMIAENAEIVLLDVRTAGEVEAGYLQNAQNIDVSSGNFEAEIGKLDKTKTYLVYCRSGSRSRSASNAMIQAGFEKVYNLEGGILAWQQAGLPLAK